MKNSERVRILTELCEESLRINYNTKIFLEGIKENMWATYLGRRIDEIVNSIDGLSHQANLEFIPEVINPTEE